MAASKKSGRKTSGGKNTGKTAKAKSSAAKRGAAARKKSAPRTASGGLALRSVAPSITVDDLQKSMAFYRDVLGFTVGDRWEQAGTLMGVELGAGAVVFMLTQDDWKKGRDRVKGEGFRLYCDTTQDVDRLAERIKAKGGVLAQEPRDEEWGARALTVEDPDGFKITIAKQTRRGR
jgi:lactoylglutathione lyase